MDVLKVLAVADPAVMAYVDDNLLRDFPLPVKMDVFPWAEYYQTMMDVFAGKAEYDVVMVAGHLWKRDFIEKGFIEPIDMEKEDILPVILEEIKYQDKTYLSPSFCDGHIIVYRKNIVKEVLGHELSDTITPKEYCEAAFKLHEAGYQIVMKADESEIFTDALPFLRMNGKDVYDDQGKIQCNCDEIIDGLNHYIELKKQAVDHTDTFGNEQVAEALKSKQASMGVTWSGQMGVVMAEDCLDKEELGFATFTTAWNVSWSFAINASCQRKNQANDLLNYLRSAKVDGLAGKGSGAPVRKGSYLDGMDQYPWYRCQLQMFSHAKLLPDLLFAGDKNGVLYHQIALAFAGKKTAQEAMKDAMKEIQSLEG